MLTPEQIEERRQGVGGSDIAAIVGTSPYATAYDIYLIKRGVAVVEETEAMYWGQALERAVLGRYAENHNDGQHAIAPDGTTTAHPGLPWCLATPDAMAWPAWKPMDHPGFRAPASPLWGVEIKTANAFAAQQWDQGVPQHYQDQCQWYMFVTGLKRWDVAVLIGGQDYREFTLERDERRQAELFDAAHTFWFGHVLREIPPPAQTPAEVRAQASDTDDGTMLWANGEQEDAIFAYKLARGCLDAAKGDEAEARAAVQAIIGDHAGIEGPWGRITWKRSGKSRRFVARFLEDE